MKLQVFNLDFDASDPPLTTVQLRRPQFPQLSYVGHNPCVMGSMLVLREMIYAEGPSPEPGTRE